jgi:hypothetical protein
VRNSLLNSVDQFKKIIFKLINLFCQIFSKLSTLQKYYSEITGINRKNIEIHQKTRTDIRGLMRNADEQELNKN